MAELQFEANMPLPEKLTWLHYTNHLWSVATLGFLMADATDLQRRDR